MHHVAIMNKSWGFIDKILSGEKKVESRWSINARSPWGKVTAGDFVYFKNSGEPVIAHAVVSSIVSYEGLTGHKVKQILHRYGKDLGITHSAMPAFFELFKSKKYCTLVFLKSPRRVIPFEVDKRGFGAMSSWMSVEDVGKIRIKSK